MSGLAQGGGTPFPVVLPSVSDELLSSWLRRHAGFYKVTEPFLIRWMGLAVPKFTELDFQINLSQIAAISKMLRCNPTTAIGMTHNTMSAESRVLIVKGKNPQRCHHCSDQFRAKEAGDAVAKSWHHAWRITCPSCGSPLADTNSHRNSRDTLIDTSAFAQCWDAALIGETIVERSIKEEGRAIGAVIALIELLLMRTWRHEETNAPSYKPGWLLDALVPGFDEAARLVKRHVNRKAVSVLPIHLRPALLAGIAITSNDFFNTAAHMRTRLPPPHRAKFDELSELAQQAISLSKIDI
jgi:hypothetical protein